MKYLVLVLAVFAMSCGSKKSADMTHRSGQPNAAGSLSTAEASTPSTTLMPPPSIRDERPTLSAEDMVLIRAERMPAWPGCEVLVNSQVGFCTEEKVSEFIIRKTNYPEQAKYLGVNGTVYVYYEVSTDGAIVNTRIERKDHELLNKEALRVINSLPSHDPGMQNGKRVRVAYTVPVNFPPR